MIHKIKLNQEFADDVFVGFKNFEVRFNDRNYQVGDVVKFTVVDNDGNIIDHPASLKLFKIMYVLEKGWGLKDGWCAFSIFETDEETERLRGNTKQ